MSGRAQPRLVLADVDGTLVTREKVVTEEAKAAAKALNAAGVELAITSGRPPRGMAMLIEPLGLRGAIAGFNGGVLVRPDLTLIECHALDPAVAAEAVRLILDRGLDAWVYTESQWLIRDPGAPHVARERNTVRFDPEIVAEFTDAHLSRSIKIVGVSDDFARVAACEKAAQEAFEGRASATRSQPYYLDVTHPQANKGAVVEALARLSNISPKDIVTIGDGPNDVLMFKKSGFSIAMGNASSEVKAQADAQTDSNECEGFAKAVRKYCLNAAAA